jgi:hypothetical protein
LTLRFLPAAKAVGSNEPRGVPIAGAFFGFHDQVAQLDTEEQGQKRSALTLGQALEALRALPDQEVR